MRVGRAYASVCICLSLLLRARFTSHWVICGYHTHLAQVAFCSRCAIVLVAALPERDKGLLTDLFGSGAVTIFGLIQ